MDEYWSRTFLNPEHWKHSVAAVHAVIDIEKWKGEFSDITADLTISDCNRQITLDFGIFGRDKDDILDDVDQLRDKAKTFRAEVNGFLDALEAAYDRVEALALEMKPRKRPEDAEEN